MVHQKPACHCTSLFWGSTDLSISQGGRECSEWGLRRQFAKILEQDAEVENRKEKKAWRLQHNASASHNNSVIFLQRQNHGFAILVPWVSDHESVILIRLPGAQVTAETRLGTRKSGSEKRWNVENILRSSRQQVQRCVADNGDGWIQHKICIAQGT